MYDVATHHEAFVGREVPVCGSIALDGRDGRLRLSDGMWPQRRVIVQLPAAPNGDPGVARVLDAVAASRGGARLAPFEARYHGRVEPGGAHENVLHVTRVDWLDGRPPEWR